MKKKKQKNTDVQNEEIILAEQDVATGVAELETEGMSETGERSAISEHPVETGENDRGEEQPVKKSVRKKTRKTTRRKKKTDESFESVNSVEETPEMESQASNDSLGEVLGDPAAMEATLEEISREIESAAGLLGDEALTEESAEVSSEPAGDGEAVMAADETPVETEEPSQAEAVIAEPEVQSDENVAMDESTSAEEPAVEISFDDEFATIDDTNDTVSAADEIVAEAEPVDEITPPVDENDLESILTGGMGDTGDLSTPAAESESVFVDETSSAAAETAVVSENASAEVECEIEDVSVVESSEADVEAEPCVSEAFEAPFTAEPGRLEMETVFPAASEKAEPAEKAWGKAARYAPCLTVHHDRAGKAAEEYRALRTTLLSRYRDERFCFMVTSAETGEGKTVTCLNLGLVMAERLDRRTIVVDYNLRDGSMAKLLGAKQGPGAAEVIQGRISLDDAIQPTVYPNLFWLPAGQAESWQVGELLSRSEVKGTLNALRERFDYVLVDTPAVNTYSDAVMTGLITGDALLVVRMRKTSKEAVDRAVRSLKATDVNLVGMVLTHRRQYLFN